MVLVKIKDVRDGYDCWGRYEWKTVYEIFDASGKYICTSDDLPACEYIDITKDRRE